MIGPEVQVPDITEAVVGFRQFILVKSSQHNYQLASPYTSEPWLTVERVAKCNKTITSEKVILDGIRPKQHSAPHKDCGCGIYAYFSQCPVPPWDLYRWASFRGLPSRVEALVTLTGRMEVHARGMRAQRARLCALATNETLDVDERAALKVIAESFGVPVVSQDELPGMASEFGRPLDDSLRPGAERPNADTSRSHPDTPEQALRLVDDLAVRGPVRRSWSERHLKYLLWVGVVANFGAAAFNLLTA